jgi:flavorubredoxin
METTQTHAPSARALPTKTYLPPLRVAPDTFVIQDHVGEHVEPMVVHLNSMLIRGEQPVVVDTGVPDNRTQYLNDLFGLVEPEDVRWVFLSHDDIDHYGNVQAVMDACPNATLITSWFTMQRIGHELAVPPFRMRWLADAEPLDIGDRYIVATRPPLFDSPTTRGLFDTLTSVYWGADCFAAPVERPTYNVAEMPLDAWSDGFTLFQQWNSPWVESLDVQRWNATVDAFAALGVTTIASTHGPALHGANVAAAIDLLRSLPSIPVAPQPGQELLDMIVASMTQPA